MTETPPKPAPWVHHTWSRWSFLLVAIAVVLATIAYKTVNLPQDAEGFLGRAQRAIAMEENAKALANLDRAIQLDDTRPRLFLIRGFVRGEIGWYDGSLADYERAVALSPADPAAYAGRALAKSRWGDAAGAIEDYSRALELDPGNGSFELGRSAVFFDLSDWNDALAGLERARALVIAGDEGVRTRLLSWATRSWLGDADASREVRDLGAVADPGDSEWYASLGNFLNGGLDKAGLLEIAEDAEIYGQEGRIAETYFYSGVRHAIAGNHAAAVSDLRSAVGAAEEGDYVVARARALLRRLLAGLRVRPVGADRRESLHLPSKVGFEVVSVEDGGPAAAAGILPGDVIVSVDGEEARHKSLSEIELVLEPGTSVPLGVAREGRVRNVSLVLR